MTHGPATPRLIRLDDPAVLRDPDPVWDDLLATYPKGLAPVLLEEGVPAYLMLTWPIHRQVLSDPQAYSRDVTYWRDWHNGVLPPDSPLRPMFARRQNPLCVDGEEHAHYRAVLSEALHRMRSEHVTSQIHEIADRLVDSFCGDGEADLVGRYAAVLPLIALCRMLGMSESDGVLMCTTMARIWRGDDGQCAYVQFEELMRRLVTQRRAAPAADLASELIAQGLSDQQVLDHLTLVIAAGHEPVCRLITTALRMVLTDRNARVSMGSTWLISQTINRCLWKHPPLPHLVGRYATRNTDLGGYPIRAGDCLVLGFGPTQRQMITTSPRLDTGDNRSHLVFGGGSHRCPERGRDLSLWLAEIGLVRILDRLPDLSLIDAPDGVAGSAPTLSAGLASLPARFTPAPRRYEGEPWNLQPPSPSTPPTSTASTQPPHSTRLARLFAWIFGG
ncbi:cytochrome P450 [Streptomonospora sp. PA3]|uniref:cytochrome P450 n=1 Tax=Streptomonospora sp. PA3 TaxID=2607326 RepID=UPI0012DE5ADD|nr:cytochrome P450 [Streptomonospora sp. PA3]MUL41579.1 cytochrome P450 [Streptomonospora sp. PA3]